MFRLILFAVGIFAIASGQCPPNSMSLEINTSICYSFHSTLSKYASAQTQCKSYGAQLVSLKNEYINVFITDYANLVFDEVIFFWSGGNKLQNPEEFQWSNGDKIEYNRFKLGQEKTNGSCISAEVNQGNWKAENCFAELSFVCEFAAGKGVLPIGADVLGNGENNDTVLSTAFSTFSPITFKVEEGTTSNFKVDTTVAEKTTPEATIHSSTAAYDSAPTSTTPGSVLRREPEIVAPEGSSTEVPTTGLPVTEDPFTTLESLKTQEPSTTMPFLNTEGPSTMMPFLISEGPSTTLESLTTEVPTTSLPVTEDPFTTTESLKIQEPTTIMPFLITKGPSTILPIFISEGPSTTLENLKTQEPTTIMPFLNTDGPSSTLKSLSVTSQCPTGWKSFNKYCYKISDSSSDWDSAELACKSEKAHLASIHSKEEAEFIAETLYFTNTTNLGICRSDNIWIGMYDIAAKRNLWSDSTPTDYTNFLPYLPGNSSVVEHCVKFVTTENCTLGWRHFVCETLLNYVCKKEAADYGNEAISSTESPYNHIPDTTAKEGTSEVPAVKVIVPSTTGLPNTFTSEIPYNHRPDEPPFPSNLCPSEWTEFESNCYKIYSHKNYTEAEKDCQSQGAHLASIHNENEQNFVIELGNKFGEANCEWENQMWIGLTRSETTQQQQNEFAWEDRSAFEYTNWAKNEPNNHKSDESCTSATIGKGCELIGDNGISVLFEHGKWNDYHCDKEMRYVCKLSFSVTVTD